MLAELLLNFYYIKMSKNITYTWTTIYGNKLTEGFLCSCFTYVRKVGFIKNTETIDTMKKKTYVIYETQAKDEGEK
jgi:hypothetical protein